MRPVERILLGVEFTDAGRSALREATLLAGTFGAEVTLLHAPGGLTSNDDRRALERTERCLERFAAELEAERVRVARPLLVPVGEVPDEALLGAIEARDPDLVLLGAGRRTALDRVLLGSTAERVVRGSDRPVWLTRPGRERLAAKRIVVAVDGSDPAHEALGAAAFLARTFVAELTTLSVVSPVPVAAGTPRGAPDARPRPLAAALARVDLHGVAHRVELREGAPAASIVEAVSAVGADLLIIGSARRTGLARLVRGNTAEKVLRQVPCSMLVVPVPGPA